MAHNIIVENTTALSTRSYWLQLATKFVAVALVLSIATLNLTLFPAPWFDEGSHLHVPKTLVRFGVYADLSSEGFRYYGPTVGVGPTVMLPIAAVFNTFGIGLGQARLVIVAYLLASIFVFYKLAKSLNGRRFAWVATALLLTSESVSIIEYGRQVLGEVPALFFLLMGLWLLSLASRQDHARSKIWLAGIMFGLSAITKAQFFLILVPAFTVTWLVAACLLKQPKPSLYWVPLLVIGLCYALWQICVMLYLGPSTAQENFRLLADSAAGAAIVFSPDAMLRATKTLLSPDTYLLLLLPALLYGGCLLWRTAPAHGPAPSKRQLDATASFWLLLLVLIVVNLAWYVFASIGWPRYAFMAMALSALFVARFFHDLTDGSVLPHLAVPQNRSEWRALGAAPSKWQKPVLHWLVLLWILLNLLMGSLPLVSKIARPPPAYAQTLAQYLQEHVSLTANIETWETEMGFLTDHAYHFPPNALLSQAVANKWLHGPAPATYYDFTQPHAPDFVLIGPFGRWVQIYPDSVLNQKYSRIHTVGSYDLYQRVDYTR